MLQSIWNHSLLTVMFWLWVSPAYAVSVAVNENDTPYNLSLPGTGLFCTAVWSNFHTSNSNSNLFNIAQSGWANGDLTLTFAQDQYGSAQITAWGDFTGLQSCFLCLCPGASISIDVQVNARPEFTSEPTLTTYAPEPYSYKVTATDPYGGNALKLTAPTQPTWLTLTDNGSGNATLAGAPGCGDSKHHSIKLEATDGLATEKQEFILDVYPCAASNLTIGGATVSTLNLAWTDNSLDETGYRLYRDGVELLPSPRFPTDTTAYTDTGLACSTTYAYQLFATNDIGDSLPIEKSATTAPCPPTDLTSTATPFQINLFWRDNSPDESGFKIFRDGQQLMPSPIVGENVTNYSDLGLTCSTPYFYEVLSTNQNGDSTRISKLITTLPCAPTELTATATPDQVNLHWVDNSPDETGFKIRRDGVELTPSPKVSQNVVSYSDQGLKCETTYIYEVFATNQFGDSTIPNVTIHTLPCAPSHFVTTATTGYGFFLRWQDNSAEEVAFTLERNGQLIQTFPVDTTEFNDWGLLCGSSYHYVLKATNALGDSFPALLQLNTDSCHATHGITLVPVINSVVSEPMSNFAQTATDVTITATGSLSEGILAGQVKNAGLVSNITLADNATLTGGKVSGFNTNLGLMQDITVTQYSEINGGNFAGTIVNNGSINNAIFAPNTQVINHGTLENAVILPGMKIVGGKLAGMVIALGSFENVEIAPNATVITQVTAIPPETFQRCNAQSMTILPASVVSELTPEQFAQIPVTALSGLTAQNMGALSPAVIRTVDVKQIAALKVEEFMQMPNDGVAKLLTNFDNAAITPKEAEKLLPPGWKMDAAGNLTPPPNTQIALRSLAVTPPEGLTLPDLPDLNSSFALSGQGTHPVLPQLNQVKSDIAFTLSQQQFGTVIASVAGDPANPKRRRKFAFMIDPDHLFILDETALKGLQINEQGQYILVTEDGKQIPITPMTKDPVDLLKILGEQAQVEIRPSGEVLLNYTPSKRMRDGEEVQSVVTFDPFIESTSEDICTTDSAGETVCDWSQADDSMQPGLRTARQVRATEGKKLIYSDGSSQKVHPAVLLPEILVQEASKIAGVEKIIFRMDGTFALTYRGTKLLLVPAFSNQVTDIPAGTEIQPSLVLQPGGTLLYRVPYRGQLFTTQLQISELPK